MKLMRLTVWEPEFTRVGPGTLVIKRQPLLPTPKEWGKLMVYHLLRLLETVVFLSSLGFLTSEIATVWLFSDIWD